MRYLVILFLSSIVSVAVAQPGDGENQSYFSNQADSGKYALIVAGPGASSEITTRFRSWAFALHDTLIGQYGYESENIILLLDDGSVSGNAGNRVTGSSRSEDLERYMAALQQRTKAGDQITVLLIGHGSGSATGSDAKLNITGPDITGAEFATLLQGFRDQDLVVINTASAGFEFTEALSGIGRVLVSATRSRAERFDPVFPGFLVDALKDRQGDRDKNGRVSVLEAFLYARQMVESWYEDQGRLATEHAVLDDNGDGLFALEPGTEAADGRLAEIAYFDTLMATDEKQSEAARQLLAEMQALEREIFLLRSRKAEYLEADYWSRLQELLVDLALKTETYNELP